MTVTPFQPIGDKARWRVVYDMLIHVPVDGVVTYQELAENLDLDSEHDRHAIQMAMRRAAKEHEEANQRAIESVPNVGYRVVQAEEHLRLARHQQKRASSALVRGQSKVENVDLNGLDLETRRAFEVVAQAYRIQSDMLRRMSVQGRKLEETVSKFTVQQAATNDEHAARLKRLEELLQRHGIDEKTED